MSKTDRTIILVGAGIVAALWLLRRINVQNAAAANDTGNGALLPPLGVGIVPLPKSNTLSTCNCPAAKTFDLPVGDFSQGGYIQPQMFGGAVPPSIGGALPS